MLQIRENAFSLATAPGEDITLALHISGGGKAVRGELVSDNPRIRTGRERFSGNSLRLKIGVDVHGLPDGSGVRGKILLITSEGERAIPVAVRISESPGPEADIPESPGDFAALARKDPDEAARVFRSAAFGGMLETWEEKNSGRPGPSLTALWRGLARPRAGRAGVEDFLTAAGLKACVTVKPEGEGASFSDLRKPVEESFVLRRSTWGSFVITLRADASFLELPRTRITDEDFIGSVCRVPFRILPDKIGSARRTAHIIMENAGEEFRFEVTAARSPEQSLRSAARLRAGRARLADALTELVLGEKTDAEVRETVLPLIDRELSDLRSLEGGGDRTEELMLMLLAAYLQEKYGDRRETMQLLRDVRSGLGMKEGAEVLTALYYLEYTAGLIPDTREGAASRIRMAAEREKDSLPILLMRLESDSDLERSAGRRLREMEKLFRRGCTSPVLYAAAYRELRKDDGLLAKLSPFFLQALHLAARRGVLTEELAVRAAYLSENEKEFSPLLYHILESAYEKWPLNGILESEVRLILKGDPRNPRYFKWYARAVENDLHIVRLYEYYAETLPAGRTGVLPFPVRRYFLYASDLSDSVKARLYANIVRARNEDPDTFEAYRDICEKFAGEALAAGRTGADPALLYQTFITSAGSPEQADRLAGMVFTARIYTDRRDLVRVIVVHRELAGEISAPLVRGTAWVPCYTRDAAVLFEDASGRRRALTEGFVRERMMDGEELLAKCAAAGASGDGMLLRIALGDADSPAAWRAIEGSAAFTDAFRRRMRKRILKYLGEHPEKSFFTPDSGRNELMRYAEADRTGLVTHLAARGLYGPAGKLLRIFGPSGLSPELLVKLTSRMLDENGDAEDPELTALSAAAFRSGKYDERILRALVRDFRGGMREMLDVRKAARDFLLPTLPLDERILGRVCFTGRDIAEGPRIALEYVSGGGRKKMTETYLAFYADRAVGGPEKIDPAAARIVTRMIDDGSTPDDAMKLMLLQYDAETGDPGIHGEEIADRLLEEFDRRDIRLSFFRELPDTLTARHHLMNRVFIEQKADPEDTVILHYALTDETEMPPEEEMAGEPLRRVFRGIFGREFMLFEGEVLTYYVTVTHDGEERKGPIRTVTAPFSERHGMTAFERINRMLHEAEQGNVGELAADMRDYARAKRAVESLFNLR